jgi:hypothetical protein
LFVRRKNVTKLTLVQFASAGASADATWRSTLATAGADALIV